MPPPNSTLAAIALGSNLNNPVAQVRMAFDELGRMPGTVLRSSSPLYRSRAVGADGLNVDQPDFCNAAALVDTSLGAVELFVKLQAIEQAHGRQRGLRWMPRNLDLDLLVYGDCILTGTGLTLPHPRMHERDFVLFPLRDIAPELMVPGLATVRELTARMESRGMELWPD